MLNQAAYGKDRIVVTKNGKDVAALVPIEDLHMIEAVEDRIDISEARKILANAKLRNWEDVKKELAQEAVKSRRKRPLGRHR
jgi:prevent-host-death family protein